MTGNTDIADATRDELCRVISDAVGGWNQNTQSITRVADAILAAGFGPVQEARDEVIAEMLEDADAESKHANWQNERHTANLVHDWLRSWDAEQ